MRREISRKANAFFKHSVKNKEKSAELLALYDKVFELNGNNVSDPSLTNYMNVVKANSDYHKNLTDEQILQRYDKISMIIDDKMAVAARKFGRKVARGTRGAATTFVDMMIEKGAWSSQTNDFGGTMHQFQSDVYPRALADFNANSPIVQAAAAGG